MARLTETWDFVQWCVMALLGHIPVRLRVGIVAQWCGMARLGHTPLSLILGTWSRGVLGHAQKTCPSHSTMIGLFEWPCRGSGFF